jgi:hypothetical protein
MRRPKRKRRLSAREAGRIAGALGLAGTVVGLGARSASGVFSALVFSTHSADSGTVSLQLPPSGGVNRLTVDAPQLVPGQTIYRAFDLKISGSVAYSTLTVQGIALTSTTLDTDLSNGLQRSIEICSVPWTESGSSPDFTYTCSGTQQTALASGPTTFGTKALSNVNLSAGATNHLRMTITLPSTSPTSMQGLTSDIQFSFDGDPRAGTDK